MTDAYVPTSSTSNVEAITAAQQRLPMTKSELHSQTRWVCRRVCVSLLRAFEITCVAEF